MTGATGQLGRLVVEDLLSGGLPAGQIAAAGRSVEKIADLADREVRVAAIDFTEPDTLVGRPVVYRSVTAEEHLAILTAAGLDAGTAQFVVALDGNTRDGLLAETSGDLGKLIGRPTTPLAEGLRAALHTAEV